jgi:hypothetical protein
MPVPITCPIEWTASVYRCHSRTRSDRPWPDRPSPAYRRESPIRMSHWEPAWEHLGNFPQAFTHLALIEPGSALRTPARAQAGPHPHVRRSSWLTRHADRCSGRPSSSRSIVQLASAASSPPCGRRCALASPALTRRPLTRAGSCEEDGSRAGSALPVLAEPLPSVSGGGAQLFVHDASPVRTPVVASVAARASGFRTPRWARAAVRTGR